MTPRMRFNRPGLVSAPAISMSVMRPASLQTLQRVQPGAFLAKGTPKMSLTSSLAAPINVGVRSAHGLLRGGSLQSMARAVGVVVGAALLAATYQFTYEEGRCFVSNIRAASQIRRARNDAVL